MTEDLKFTLLKKWDDARLQGDGTAKLTTKIRFMLGTYGPFEEEFDRDADASVMQQRIAARRFTTSQVLQA